MLAQGPSHKAGGEDTIVNEVYKVAPQIFAGLVHPLLVKIVIRIEHPLFWKGGMVHELMKAGKVARSVLQF